VSASTEQRTSVVGWRFWLVRPGQDLLLSPYDCGPTWPTVALAATCSTDSAHCPPAPGCDCGVYAERTGENACERVRRRKKFEDETRTQAPDECTSLLCPLIVGYQVLRSTALCALGPTECRHPRALTPRRLH
jgi:hypothetical protein